MIFNYRLILEFFEEFFQNGYVRVLFLDIKLVSFMCSLGIYIVLKFLGNLSGYFS